MWKTPNKSPWPFLSIVFLLAFVSSIASLFYLGTNPILCFATLLLTLFSLLFWIFELLRCYSMGYLTRKLTIYYQYVIPLFIIMEALVFGSFFWTLIHVGFSPDVSLGEVWPPKGVVPFDTWGVPLLNTFLLLASAFTCTLAQSYFSLRYKIESFLLLQVTIILGSLFIFGQYNEYLNALFTIGDSVYGSGFFAVTFFHGSHVFIGIVFLFISSYRLLKNNFNNANKMFFEFSLIYWHFVDIIWLFVYSLLYIWVTL